MIHPGPSRDPETPPAVGDGHAAPPPDALAPPSDGEHAGPPAQDEPAPPPTVPVPEAASDAAPPMEAEPKVEQADVVQQLEERIRRLEATLTTMQEIHAQELAQAQAALPVAAVAPPAPLATIVPGPAEPGLREKAGQWMQAGKRMLAVAPLATAAAIPMARLAVNALGAQPSSSSLGHPWVVIEMFQELRAIVRMYLDRSYRPGLYAWVVPVAALSFMICSYFFLGNAIPLVGPILDKIVDLFLILITYKVLVREADRHQQHLLQQQPLR